MTYQSSTSDVALIGGGIMSITLAALIAELDPNLALTIYESQEEVATESSNPWNNAGTGHSALCELNYTPMRDDGTVDPTKAYRINEAFQISRQFWSYLVNAEIIPDPRAFLHPVPHMSLVWGQANIDFLKKRFETLKDHPLFVGMQYSDDIEQIGRWAPLLVEGRNTDPNVMEPMAATFVQGGTDVNFGRLTHLLSDHLKTLPNVEFKYLTKVTNLRFDNDAWLITHKSEEFGKRNDVAKTVFVGSGGAALTLLQKSKIREVHGYGGFPISGQFLRTLNPELVSQHSTKVYGKASVKAPPMSVPHLDARVVDGQHAVLFGPYAGWTPKFLKKGSLLDLFKSLRWHNLYPMITSGLQNLGLVKYLLVEVFASRKKRLKSLQAYFPAAKMDDWELITAGQRVQIIKPKPHSPSGELVLGTEVVASSDQRIAGLLGASPGASTATAIMLEVLEVLFPERMNEWSEKIREMIPSYGLQLADHPELAEQLLKQTAESLKIPL